MRVALAATAAAIALLGSAPAWAGEGHIDIHTGLGWSDGLPSKALAGGSVGYDWNKGPVFIGVEQSIDKVLISDSDARWGTSARIGTQVSPGFKVYATGGYNYGQGPDGTDIGAGVEKSYGPIYGRVEYKHFFNNDGAIDTNAATVGVGIHF